MSGPVALHGGGEFLPGDEPFLRALIDAAVGPAEARGGAGQPIRVLLVPTAAARQQPDVAARVGAAAFARIAGAGRALDTATARVVDAASAADPLLAAELEAADLIYLPGGDPDVIPNLLPGSAAWRAIETAHRRGAVLAGASAGAMALCRYTWTRAGILTGLDVIHEMAVFPHADAVMWERQSASFAIAAAAGVGVLGLGERTGVISPPDLERAATRETSGWRVVGEGEVRWLPPGAADPEIALPGDLLALPA